jgi:hypothetical protein
MRKTIKWAMTAGLFLLLSGMGYSALSDDGQLSSWEDSKFLDYPPPPAGGHWCRLTILPIKPVPKM